MADANNSDSWYGEMYSWAGTWDELPLLRERRELLQIGKTVNPMSLVVGIDFVTVCIGSTHHIS